MRILKSLLLAILCCGIAVPVSALDGYVLLVKSSSRYGTGNLVIRNMTNGEEKVLVQASVISACFSPDAKEIVYGTSSTISAVPSAGGNPRRILNSGTGSLDYVQWATDGYIYWTGGSNIYRVKANGSGSKETYWNVPSDLSGSGFRYWSLAQNGKWAGASPQIDGDGRAVFLNLEKKQGQRFATGCQVSANNAGTAITYAIDGHKKWYIKSISNHTSVGGTIKDYSQSSSIAGHRFSHFSDKYVMYATESGMNGYLRDIETNQEISTGKGRPWDYYPRQLDPVNVSITDPSSGTTLPAIGVHTMRRIGEKVVLSGYPSTDGEWRLIGVSGKTINQGQLQQNFAVINGLLQPAGQVLLLQVQSGDKVESFRLIPSR